MTERKPAVHLPSGERQGLDSVIFRSREAVTLTLEDEKMKKKN